MLVAAGEPDSFENVAKLMNAAYAKKARRWAKLTGEQVPATKTADAGTKQGTEPSTISNDLAAQSSGPDDREMEPDDYLANAIKTLKEG